MRLVPEAVRVPVPALRAARTAGLDRDAGFSELAASVREGHELRRTPPASLLNFAGPSSDP